MPNDHTQGSSARGGRRTHTDSMSSSMTSSRRRELSRHRDSISSNVSTAYHIDENETEMFSGAASHVVPSSISSFHHHNISQHTSSYKSPALSISSANRAHIDDLDLDNPDLELTTVQSINSNADFQERANFRFFTTEEIESAKGTSSLKISNNHDPAHVMVDYDTNWNTYESDYETDEVISRPGSVVERPLQFQSLSDYGSIQEAGSSRSVTTRETTPLYANDEDELSSIDHDNTDARSALKVDIRYHDKLFGSKFPATNLSQRFYIAEEDLVIGIAGYKTSKWKLVMYYTLILCTFGLGYLILRWYPRLRIKMMADAIPLGKAEWVVVEDEYGVLDIQPVDRHWYNRVLSTFIPRSHSNHDNHANADKVPPSGVSTEGTGDDENKDDSSIGWDQIDPVVPVLISFEYRYMKLFYDPLEDLFKLSNTWIDEKWSRYPDIKDGISEETYKSRKLIFGSNLINIKQKSIVQLLTDEILHPFYMFQVFSILLWLADDYYYYAFCIFLISVISIIESLVETKTTMDRMRNISRFQCDVRVWRNGFWKEIMSEELVPGDIYEVSDPSLTLFPCDAILLSGDCIVNEAMLTGESVPVSKVPVSSDTTRDLENEFTSTKLSNNLSRSFLYSGTKIVRCRYGSNNEAATALVVRTGFNTTKGALVRSMLFPKPSGFKFYEDSFKYIGVMASIAGVGFIFSTINFIKLGLGWKIIILRALDLITIVVPPALPATLTIGTSFALSRLRKKNIFCIAPTRVNVGGKLDVMCFDKTGTLTEEGLDIMGVRVSQPIRGRKEHEFSKLHTSVENLFDTESSSQSYELFLSMLTCHSLKVIEDEVIGDPLDIKMFEFTEWDIIEEVNEDQVLAQYIESHKIPSSLTPILLRPKDRLRNDTLFIQLKEFEFVSQLRRMSVITHSITNPSLLNIYVKGAPEVIETLCSPESLPINYHELLHQYTHNGYRVIACASKSVKVPNTGSFNDLTFLNDISREKCETELTFVGFVIFENRLKSSTKGALKELSDAELRTIMCTGDNVLTAVSVGRECELIKPDYKVYIPSFDYDYLPEVIEGNEEELDVNGTQLPPPIIWSEVDNPDMQLDPVTLAPQDINQDDKYCIAVTGDIFKYILTELSDRDLLIEKMLMRGAIFARMSPDEKHELVDRLKALDYTVGFCGDGANDCGALKAADVGISLSEAEASVAAPFTSRVFEISCVLDVIKEGRASLVTSFSCFQYMSLYSAIQFVTVSILYKEGTNLGDFQFLYIDLFLIIPIAIFMSWSKPHNQLCVKRPTANLISPKILIPLIGNIAVLCLFQLFIWTGIKDIHEPWYVAPIPGNDDEVKSTDNTVLFLYSNFQYIFVAVMLTVGPPYREPATRNVPFLLAIGGTLLVSTFLMVIDPDTWLGDLMDLTWISGPIKFSIILAALLCYFSLEACDKLVFSKIAKVYKRLFGAKGSKKKFKNLRTEFKSLNIIV
ncbi:hypothetical protein CANARDRAFT_208586 [[Candida] arabinofermentans NRRL YB-2248]|uniref:Cation-transporting ATPase n=1 Tax=[Candida] arabinofermentans NRRL YB-2248 TaxID=983967 RepID=A0A1E4SXL4_9ASCO|nr:hypothetical protein CANARDRAFT_208586 [[Candida] arabinofermentans NRRL YB-2248]